ncbi:MAG: hypothetical protein OXP66_00250, partial [Candidatus Tectomicrobia bacterium]|nr:hypothetical protein [Candidatus Tectomicrobia bacterium]
MPVEGAGVAVPEKMDGAGSGGGGINGLELVAEDVDMALVARDPVAEHAELRKAVFNAAESPFHGVDTLIHGVETLIHGVETLIHGVETLVHLRSEVVEPRVHVRPEVVDAPVHRLEALVHGLEALVHVDPEVFETPVHGTDDDELQNGDEGDNDARDSAGDGCAALEPVLHASS